MLRHGSAAHAGNAAATVVHVNFRFVESRLQPVNVAGKILQQVHRDIEVDDKRLVFIGQNLSQKSPADFFLHVEDVALAAAGGNHDFQRGREIRVGREILNGLRPAIFRHVEIIFGKVGDQSAVLVFDVKEKLHYI